MCRNPVRRVPLVEFAELHSILCTEHRIVHTSVEDVLSMIVRSSVVPRKIVGWAEMIGIVRDRELATAMNLALCELSM
jgi:hypothetical protein